MIPATYTEWRQCIEQRCHIELNASFITTRIKAMSAPDTPGNKTFIRCYGIAHYERVLNWLQQAAQDLAR